MSDEIDDANGWRSRSWGGSRASPLQSAMKAFLEVNPPERSLKSVREEIRDGTSLSKLVEEGRVERT